MPLPAFILAAAVLSAAGERELADRVRDRLLRELPEATVIVEDSMTLTVRMPDKTEGRVSLDNLERQCARGEKACSDGIEVTVANQVALRHADELIRPENIRFTLKDSATIAEINRTLGEKTSKKQAPDQLVTEPFVADLSLVYVVDMPQGMRMLTSRDLEQMNVGTKRLRGLARANLHAAGSEVAMVPVERTGIWTNAERDDYDSARLVFADLWGRFAKEMGGKLVVSVPARNVIFAAGPGTPAQLEELRRLTNRAYGEEHHPLSRQLFEWSPSGWKVRREP